MSTYSSTRYIWSSTSGTTPLSTTTSTLVNTAQSTTDYNGNTIKLRNYLTDLSFVNNSSTATAISILDGSTVIWTGYADHNPSAQPAVPVVVNLTTPLKGSPNTALNIQCATTGAGVYWSASGFVAS
jgi:hypothetical protein